MMSLVPQPVQCPGPAAFSLVVLLVEHCSLPFTLQPSTCTPPPASAAVLPVLVFQSALVIIALHEGTQKLLLWLFR